MAEDVLDNQQRPEANYGRKLFKDIPEEQVIQVLYTGVSSLKSERTFVYFNIHVHCMYMYMKRFTCTCTRMLLHVHHLYA